MELKGDILRTVIGREAIARRVGELARQITRDLTERGEGRVGVTLVPVMSGSLVFTADLIRHMPLRMDIRLVALRSYPGTSTTSTGAVVTLGELPTGLAGRHVLIIDDVLDTGRTMAFIRQHVESQEAASVRVCVLLRKRKAHAVEAHYVGFEIEDEFVVGYGLDYDGRYRNWPDIVTLTAEAMKAHD